MIEDNQSVKPVELPEKTAEHQPPQDIVTFLSLGGEEDVTRNMYLYQYKDEILIVDCGLGFPDETMLGVDLLLPDISYLLSTKKKIVGMVLTHGHEDHIGGLPFILPQLPQFPIYASPFTAALANEKLSEFNLKPNIKSVKFQDGKVKIGHFEVGFIRVTHSVPDSANFFIKTPVGSFFHASDYKVDLTPADGKRTEFLKVAQAAEDGVLALMSDCLGSDRPGFSHSEAELQNNIEDALLNCKGKCIITTYSSNVARLNQTIAVAEKLGRKVCFVGRSLIKVKQVAQRLGYLHMKSTTEVSMDAVHKIGDHELLLIVAGSQGQENSAMTRIANGEHREFKLSPEDLVLFSADPIPGNEVAVSELVNTISKQNVKVVYSDIAPGQFHVSGHGSQGDHKLMIALTQPKFLVPISGTYRHMVGYRDLSNKMGYHNNQIFLIENGQEVIFTKNTARLGQKIDIKNVYVDEVSGEELENFVIRDREKLAREGVIILMIEIKASDGQLANKPDIIMRGSSLADMKEDLSALLKKEIEKLLSAKKGRITNWVHTRRNIGDAAERVLFKKFRSQPLILPIVIEV
jgi:ribonuclease J